MTKLSIITINYNDIEGLRRTFYSVVNQSFKDFEYIVIDGGSDDGSKEFLEDNRLYFHYWVSEPDKGIYNAMNKGILAANGEYLLFLNSGDTFYKSNTLFECLKIMKTNDVDIFYGNNILIDEKMNESKTFYPPKVDFSYFMNNSFCHQSSFIKKDKLIEIGMYDENLKIVSDWKFFIVGIFKQKYSTLYLNLFVSKFYRGGISSTNNTLLVEENKKVLKDEFPFFYEDYKEFIKLKNYSKKYKFDFLINLIDKIKGI